MEAGLRLITERLAVPAALLFAARPGGALCLSAAVGTWGDDPRAFGELAETLAGGPGGVLDLDGAVGGVRFAAGAGLGDGEGALLVIAPHDRAPDAGWNRAFADSAQLALGLLRSTVSGGATRVLHEVSVHPGSFDERLELALVRLADVLGLDAAAFARAGGHEWRAEAAFDPSGRLVPTGPVPLRETFCAFTVQSDGPFAVPDAPASPVPLSAPAAYLGAPVFVGGRCAGTLSAVGHAPRARPFTDDDRALIEGLARWVGSAVDGRETARRLAAREADLSAFFDAAPVGMAIARLAGPADLQIVAANAAAAALLGGEPERLRGPVAGAWLAACRRTRDTGRPERSETDVDGPDGPRTLTATVAPIAGYEDARFTVVVEDTTGARRAGGPAAGPASGSEARGALLKHLDHEIRSPLTSILGYADLLSERTPPAEVAEVRDVIGRAGERLLAALDDLLDLTLLGEDAIAVHPAPVDAAAVVARVAEESRPAAEARRLALNLWCTLPQEPVLLDARLFERVVRHLVSGAVSEAAGTRVDVSLRPAGPDGMELGVAGGLPGGGGGIGPDLVHRLVRAMGGTSREAGGGDWTVRLPRRRVPVVELAPPAEATAGPDGAGRAEGRGRADGPEPGSDGRAGEAPAMDLGGRAG